MVLNPQLKNAFKNIKSGITHKKIAESTKTIETVMQELEIIYYDFYGHFESQRKFFGDCFYKQNPQGEYIPLEKNERLYMIVACLIDFLEKSEKNDIYNEIKNKIAFMLNQNHKKLIPYAEDKEIKPEVIAGILENQAYRTEKKVMALYNDFVISAEYNTQILIDFLQTWRSEPNFPCNSDVIAYCDPKIEFLEQIRILIELVL